MKDIGNGEPITNAEVKFWTRVKTFFLCEEHETPHWSDIVWMLIVGIGAAWIVLLGLGVMASNM